MIEPNKKGYSKWSHTDKTAMIQEFIRQKREFLNPCIPPINDNSINEIY